MSEEIKDIIKQAAILITKAAISESPEENAQKIKAYIFTEITDDNILAQAIWEMSKGMALKIDEWAI